MEKEILGKVQAGLNKRGVTTNVLTSRPLERVEIDWTPLDIMIVDLETLKTKRYYLIYAIDAHTGYSLGFYLTSKEPNVAAIKQCLLHCMLPKLKLKELYPNLKNNWTAYGVPETIVLDNAKVNESRELEEICSLMGIEVQYVPVKSGHEKGKVERALKTINDHLHKLPGTTFSNTQQKSQYDAEGKAVLNLKTLYEILHIIFIDVLAQEVSLAVGGKPADVWENSLIENKVHRKLPYQKEHLKQLLSTGLEFRTIQNNGVTIQSQNFTSTELMNLKDLKSKKKDDRDVKVRFDKADMREVYIYDEYNKRYIKAFPIANSFAKKGFDENFPVHYEQIHAFSYNIESEYRESDTTGIALANKAISNLVHESKKRRDELARIPESERAGLAAQELSDIETYYSITLGMEDLDTLELITDDENNQEPKVKGKKKAKNIKDRINPSRIYSKKKDIVSTKEGQGEYEEEELKVYSSTSSGNYSG